jgi:hypothetical protein
MKPMKRETPMISRSSGSTAGWIAAVLLAVGALGCGEAPVAELGIQPEPLRLGYPRSSDLALTWRLERALPPDAAPIVFVHLLSAAGDLVRTFDHAFPGPWRPGEEVRDIVAIYQSALGPGLPPGAYRLTAGLYGREGRWRLRTAGEEVGPREYAVARVDVDAPAPTAGFGFDDGWLPLEPGRDRQVLGRRWLGAGEGTIRSPGSPGATLWLRLLVPHLPPDARAADGAPITEPQLFISPRCTGGDVMLAGAGTHDVRLPLPAAAPCDVRLRPNFHFEPPLEAPRSVALEVLAWSTP